jgi:hypothetical protein
MSTQPVPSMTLAVKLDADQLRALESQLSNPMVSSQTSDLEAGFKLGIQHTLKVLRDGFTYTR